MNNQNVLVTIQPNILSIAWGVFKRVRWIIISYVILFLCIIETSNRLLPSSFIRKYQLLNSDITITTFGINIFKSWLCCGFLRVALDAVRGYRFNRKKLITPLSEFFRVSVVGAASFMPYTIATQLIDVSRIFLLLFIPVIYLALMWSQFCLLLLDHKARFFDALSLSAKMTRHKKGLIISAFIVPMFCALPADIATTFFLQRESASMVGDGLLTVSLLIANSWILVVSAFLMVTEAVVYQELLTG